MITASLWASSCKKLGYKPAEVPVEFAGIKTVFETKAGTLIVSWTEPANAKDLVDSYEIYSADMSSSSSANLAEDPSNDSASSNAGAGSRMIVAMKEEQTPAVTGKVLAVVRGENSYTIADLSPGIYGIQVKAVGKNGVRDTNTMVAIVNVVLSVKFSGIKSAEKKGDKLILSWDPLVTNLKGEPIHYIVYEGSSFSEAERIAIVKADPKTGLIPNTYEVSLKEKEPGSRLTYGVRVKDPLDRIDSNVNTVTVQAGEATSEEICTNARPGSTRTVIVTFRFPDDADSVSIRRNGFLVTTIRDRSKTEYEDIDLRQGTRYEYSCEATRFGRIVQGSSVKSAITRSSEAPTFAGIRGAVRDPATGKVTVSWDDGTNVPVDYYKVYASPGSVVQWSQGETRRVSGADVTTIFDSLGDQFTHSIGVRACSIANFCDTNDRSVLITVPDTGAPKSVGVTDLELVAVSPQGPKLIVTAPWKPDDGYVASRKIYYHRAPTVDTLNSLPECKSDLPEKLYYVTDNSVYRSCTGSQSSTWGWQDAPLPSSDIKFFQKQVVAVPDSLKFNPPTRLELLNINENSMYTIIVRDGDGVVGASGEQESSNMVSRQIVTPDFSPPLFQGVSSVELGPRDFLLKNPPEPTKPRKDLRDSALLARFNAPAIDQKVSHYQVYLREVSGPAEISCPAPSLVINSSQSALSSGTLFGELAVTDSDARIYDDNKQIRFWPAISGSTNLHIPGSPAAILITGLKERTDYIVCLRARDDKQNVSITSVAMRISTIDITPPLFEGVQFLSYDPDSGALKVEWAKSSSKDVDYYKVDMWGFDQARDPNGKPSYPTSPGDFETHQTVTAKKTESSVMITAQDAPEQLKSNYKIHVIVNACDDGGLLQGGQQNCTAFPVEAAMPFTLNDIEPPPFGGIQSNGHVQFSKTENEVEVTIKWKEPSDWTDFEGFIIYEVIDGSEGSQPELRQLLTCPAYTIVPGTTPTKNYLTSCTVGGLDPFRRYKFHVRAFDAVTIPRPNISLLNPVTFSAVVVTEDVYPPRFSNPGLTGSYAAKDGGIKLSWKEATDNQYSGNPDARIRYQIFRKDGLPAGSNPVFNESGMIQIATADSNVYTDTIGIEGGRSYSYAICAVDATWQDSQSENNRTCRPGRVINVEDTIAPTISDVKITKHGSDDAKEPDAKKWDVVVSVSDNRTTIDQLLFELCVETSSLSNGPIPPDKITCTGEEPTSITPDPLDPKSGKVRFSGRAQIGLGGPPSLDTYVNYLVRVTEQLSNNQDSLVETREISQESKNFLALDSIKSNEGSLSGRDLLVLKGKGFGASSRVTVGGIACDDIQFISSGILTCRTPAAATAGPAAVQVSVENPDEVGQMKSSTTPLAAQTRYSYCEGLECINICNRPTSTWNTDRFAAGNGRSDNPWIICNETHLRQLATAPVPAGESAPSFKLGANIDLASLANPAPIGNCWTNLGENGTDGSGRDRRSNNFDDDGNGRIDDHWGCSNTPTASAANTVYVRSRFVFDGDDFVIANFTFSNPNRDGVGLFANFDDGTVGFVKNLGVLNVNVVGRNDVGGLTGATLAGRTFSNIFVTGRVEGRGNDTGGVIGDNQSNLENASASGITVITGWDTVGGLIGYQRASGRAMGALSANGLVQGRREHIGGLFGYYESGGVIQNPSFSGSVILPDNSSTCTNIRPTSEICRKRGSERGSPDPCTNEISQTRTTCENNTCGFWPGDANNPPSCYANSWNGTGGIFGSLPISSSFSMTLSNPKVSGTVAGRRQTGGVIGRLWNGGSITVTGAQVNGSVRGWDYVGGIAANFDTRGAVQVSSATVSGQVAGGSYVGGLFGQFIGNCTDYYTPGDAGSNPTARVEDSRSFASVSSTWVEHIGGAFGLLQCAGVSNTNAQGPVTVARVGGDSYHIGGFVGRIESSRIENSRSTGKLTVTSNVNSRLIGGFFGTIYQGWNLISNSHATGDMNVTGYWVGGFGGYSRLGVKDANSAPSKIINSSASGNVTTTYNNSGWNGETAGVGGFIGLIENGIYYRQGHIPTSACTGDWWGSPNPGGLNPNNPGTGCATWGQYERNRATGNVKAEFGRHAGGFVGHIASSAEDGCIFTLNASNQWVCNWGRVADRPWNQGRGPREELLLTKNYATGSVTARGHAGGFAGSMQDNASMVSITQNYATGNVAVTLSASGGFIGAYNPNATQVLRSMLMSDNYARGNVKANTEAGGFGAYLGLIVQRSYSTGSIESGSLGGFHFNTPNGSVANGGLGSMPGAFWDKTVAGSISSRFGAGRSTIEMQDQATFTGYDFGGIWIMPDGGGYPILKWQVE